MLASLDATRSASSDPFHLIKYINSPGESVAPMIFSGSKPRPNPRLLSLALAFNFSVTLKMEKKIRESNQNVSGGGHKEKTFLTFLPLIFYVKSNLARSGV